MFSKLKAALPGGKAKGGGGGGPSAAEKAEKDRIAKEARELEKQEALQMKLLPWAFGDYVKMALFMVIKLPFILCVGLLGILVELEIRKATTSSWHRPTMTTGPSCFVAELKEAIFNYNTTLNDLAKDAGIGPLYNESALIKGNKSKWLNYTFTETDRCGLMKDVCKIDPSAIGNKSLVEDHGWFSKDDGGIMFGSLFPFAALWMLYKLVWIPLWPVDRIALKLAGDVHPPPQPIFRLVTQPHFQVGTGVLTPLMMILNMLRYVFLPNYLLLPLVSLKIHKHCRPHHIFVNYEMDWFFGQAAYIWLVVDFFTVLAAYAFFKFVKNGQAVGTCFYRLYKVYWLMTCFTSIGLFICNIGATFDLNFLGGLNFAFQMVIDFNLLFSYSMDMLAFMATANTIMEALSLTYTIGGLLLPYILRKVPCFKRCFDDPADSKVTPQHHAEEGHALIKKGQKGRR